MTKRICTVLVTLILLMVLVIPPVSAADYGKVYDETELLWSGELETLGNETLPAFAANYYIDLRVDVLTTIGDFETLERAATYIYSEFGYGSADGNNGLSLTLLVYPDENGVSLEDWFVYAGGSSGELTTNGPDWIYQALEPLMGAEMWAGDQSQDAQMLTLAVQTLVDSAESFVLSGGVADTIWNPYASATPDATEDTTPEQTEPTGDWMDQPVSPAHVTDETGMLTKEQWSDLEQQARDLEETYGFGVYLIYVEDYTAYADGTVEDAAVTLYEAYSLGCGTSKEGILLLMSTEGRDYALYNHGTYSDYAFSYEGQIRLTPMFLDDFAEDRFYDGFSDYLLWCGRYLQQAEAGNPYGEDNVPMSDWERAKAIGIRVAIILLVPLLVAGIWVLVLTTKMKSVAKATEASTYVDGQLELEIREDLFTHTTVSRRTIETERSKDDSTAGTSGKY